MKARNLLQEGRPRNIPDRLVPLVGGAALFCVVGLGVTHAVDAFINGGGGNNQIASPPAAGIVADVHDGKAEIDFCFSDPTAPAVVTSFNTESRSATITWPGPAGENNYQQVGKDGLAKLVVTHSAELQPKGTTPEFPVFNGLAELAIPCSVTVPTNELILPGAIERDPTLLEPQAASNSGGSVSVAIPRGSGGYAITLEHIPA